MGYYKNKHVHFDGALLLYQRNLAVAVPNANQHRTPTWYMRLKINGHKGYHDRSTGLTSYEEAYLFAKSELLRLQQNVRLGFTLDEYTFEQHWDDWFERNKLINKWKTDRQDWHEKYAKRYFKPYFSNADGSSKLLNEITPQMADGYWVWRITYWQREQGERLIASNPKRRGAKTRSTNNAKKQPAGKTLEMEQSALNEIFSDAAKLRRLQQVLKLRSPLRSNAKDDRRPNFETGTEYKKLTQYLNSYRKCVGIFRSSRISALHRKQREQLYVLVMTIANSGLRPGEARQLVWADIKFDVPMHDTDRLIAEIRVPANTKVGYRYVQTMPNANKYLKLWRKLTPYADDKDPVFFGQKSENDDKPIQFVDLNKSFQSFLRRIPVDGRDDGMLRNRDGKIFTLYSLRHTYATMRRELGDVDPDYLASNMGCTTAQLLKTYVHVEPKQVRPELTHIKPKPQVLRRLKAQQAAEEAAKAAASPTADEAFKLEALRRFQRGELSETAFIEIVKLGKSV